jgi:hypothetical protein
MRSANWKELFEECRISNSENRVMGQNKSRMHAVAGKMGNILVQCGQLLITLGCMKLDSYFWVNWIELS